MTEPNIYRLTFQELKPAPPKKPRVEAAIQRRQPLRYVKLHKQRRQPQNPSLSISLPIPPKSAPSKIDKPWMIPFYQTFGSLTLLKSEIKLWKTDMLLGTMLMLWPSQSFTAVNDNVTISKLRSLSPDLFRLLGNPVDFAFQNIPTEFLGFTFNEVTNIFSCLVTSIL